MLKFRILTILTVALVFATFAFDCFIVSIPIFVVYLALVVRGVVRIDSQMFVDSYCQNRLAEDCFALTFDDCVSGEQTEQLRLLLSEFEAKATFFMIGSKLLDSKNLQIAKSLIRDGHSVGNHTFWHKNTFPIQSVAKSVAEIESTQNVLKSELGVDNKFFRPPFGVTNPLIAKALKYSNLIVVGWSIRSLDTVVSDSREKILNRVISQLKAGDIVLLHDFTPDVLWITRQILIYAKSQNLKSVNIEQLMKCGI